MKRRNTAIIVSALVIVLSVISVLNKDLSDISDIETLGKTLGLVTLAPTFLAVFLAFITKNVVISLLIGFLTGSLITTLASSTGVLGFAQVSFTSLWGVVSDSGNLITLTLCLLMGGLIRLVKLSGGFDVIAKKLEKNIDTAPKANLLGALLGCGIFFDDYANAMVLGPLMTRFGKKLKIAKEKIAYIVNSTSAPVAGTCLLSSWAAVELSCIEKGLQSTGIVQEEFFLLKNSFGFTFYCMFTITFIIIGALSNRDFGPMLKAEQAARQRKKKVIFDTNDDDDNAKLLVGIGSMILLIVMSMILIYISGRTNAISQGILSNTASFSFENIFMAVACADSIEMIILAIAVSTIFSIIAIRINKLMTFKVIIKAILEGFKNMLNTLGILILAWSLSEIMGRIGTVYYSVELISMNVNWRLIPVLLLVCCCVVSSASGSYGCMFVVMPIAIPLAQKMVSNGIDLDGNLYLYLVIGSVISGSIFGDACSPISDCVTLTSESVDIGPTQIIWTTILYSLINIAISMMAIMLVVYNCKRQIALLLGILLQICLYFIFGKNVKERL